MNYMHNRGFHSADAFLTNLIGSNYNSKSASHIGESIGWIWEDSNSHVPEKEFKEVPCNCGECCDCDDEMCDSEHHDYSTVIAEHSAWHVFFGLRDPRPMEHQIELNTGNMVQESMALNHPEPQQIPF